VSVFEINEKNLLPHDVSATRRCVHQLHHALAAELADWCACERPSVVYATPTAARPRPVSVCILRRRSRAPKNPSRIDAAWGGEQWGGGKRVRATVCVGGWCMCVRVRPGPTGDDETAEFRSRPQSAPRHTYPACRSTTTARNRTVRQSVRRRALRERSPIGIIRYSVVINRDSIDCRRFSVLPLVTPPARSVHGFPVPRSFRTRPAFDRSAHSGDLAGMTINWPRRIVGHDETTVR